MPKLSLSRRHRRQSNLAQLCWNGRGSTGLASSPSDGDCFCSSLPLSALPTEKEARFFFGHATPRMVSDEDMRPSASSLLSPSSSSEGAVTRRCGCGGDDSGLPYSHPLLPAHKDGQRGRKRPKPSSGVGVPDPSAGGSPSRLQRARPSGVLWGDPPAGAPLDPSESPVASATSPPHRPPAVVSPCSPWGHFVDLHSHHEQDDSLCGGCEGPYLLGNPSAGLAPTTAAATAEATPCPTPGGDASLLRFLPSFPGPLVRRPAAARDPDSPYHRRRESTSSPTAVLGSRKRPISSPGTIGGVRLLGGSSGSSAAGQPRTTTMVAMGSPSLGPLPTATATATAPCSLRGFVLSLPIASTTVAEPEMLEGDAGRRCGRYRGPDGGGAGGLRRRPEACDRDNARQQQLRALEEARAQFGNLHV